MSASFEDVMMSNIVFEWVAINGAMVTYNVAPRQTAVFAFKIALITSKRARFWLRLMS